MTRTANATIKHTETGAELVIPQQQWWESTLKEAFKDGALVTIEIKLRRKPRSLSQNSTLHWYIQEISDETGIDKDDVKEFLRHKFLSVDAIDKNGDIMADKSSGEVLKVYRSTTGLSTTEFNLFTEEIRVWALDFLGLYLPLPNETTELKFT